MKTSYYYNGRIRAGTTVVLNDSYPALRRIYRDTGVVAEMTDEILSKIQPGEIPVRFAIVSTKRIRKGRGQQPDETVVLLVRPEWINIDDSGNSIRKEVPTR
jgi:hypothetical protein